MPIPMLDHADVDVMRRQFNAWMLGAVARAAGTHKLSENPNPSRSAEGDAWENGWEQIDYSLERRKGARREYRSDDQ